jgi:hypothetical protein
VSYPGSFQCAPDISLQSDEIPFSCAVPSDQHEVGAGHRTLRQKQPCRFLQPPARSVANNGVSDLPGHGEAQSGGQGVGSGQGLENDATYRCLLASRRHAQKLRPALQTTQRRGIGCRGIRLPDGRIPINPGVRRGWHGRHTSAWRFRRTASCGPWHGGWPRPCDRQRSPCGREIHACACGPAWTVDRCASRRLSENHLNSDPAARPLASIPAGAPALGDPSRGARYTDGASLRQSPPRYGRRRKSSSAALNASGSWICGACPRSGNSFSVAPGIRAAASLPSTG